MKLAITAALLLLTACASQSTPPSPVMNTAKPADMELIDQLVLPPLPQGKTASDFVKETQVVTRNTADETITEYRFKGKAYKMVVKPNRGPAYTLLDEKGDGKFVRQGELQGKVSVPMWVILTW
jgi:hypothetical protein